MKNAPFSERLIVRFTLILAGTVLIQAFGRAADATSSGAPLTGQFKAILSSPPIIREMLFMEKLPPEHGRPPSLEHGITRSTNYSIGLLVWQPGAMMFRTLATTNLAQERGLNGPAFISYNDRVTFIEGRTNILVYEMEHERVTAGEFPPVFDAGTYRMRRASEPLNLGLSHLLPGSVQWEGNRFHATGSADKKPIKVSGEISAFTNGVPSELRVRYLSDRVAADYRIAYTYSSLVSPYFPETITLYFIRNGREIEYRAYRILKVITSDEPLPATVFDAYSYVPRDQTTVRLATNDSTFLVLPTGRLLETPSGVSPKLRLTTRDYYRNRYAYLVMAAVTLGFCVLVVRAQRKTKANKTSTEGIS